MSNDSLQAGKRARKTKKSPGQERDDSKLTSEALHEAALRYLDRYDASVDQLRRVLRRRVVRWGTEAGKPAALDTLEKVLQRLSEARLVDDERFARGFVRGQRLKGSSASKVRQKLRQRGVQAELVDRALETLHEEEGLSDHEAARAYVKKRRLKARAHSGDPKQRHKALAALARQGFSFEVARRALEDDEE